MKKNIWKTPDHKNTFPTNLSRAAESLQTRFSSVKPKDIAFMESSGVNSDFTSQFNQTASFTNMLHIKVPEK